MANPEKTELLLTRSIYRPAVAALEEAYTVHKLWLAPDPARLLREAGPRVRALVTPGITGFTRADLDVLPALEIIALFGSNTTLDLAPARERGIPVTNTPDSISEGVADLAIGLLISAMRRICECDRFVRSVAWPETPPPVGREVRGKVCGIVGYGRIGAAVAQRAAACGMTVRYQGPRRKPVDWPYHEDVLSLAQASDCLVVTCPSKPQTRNLIDARVLDALGNEGYLVNVARGAIIDEEALITALAEKRIAGAGLDVYRDEPQVPAALRALDNVVLTPHVGSTTIEIREGRKRMVLENLRRHFAGEPLLSPLP
jgi:lactate dehydrogenase-like 2-hydroxyacid dehydrogenase